MNIMDDSGLTTRSVQFDNWRTIKPYWHQTILEEIDHVSELQQRSIEKQKRGQEF